MQSCIVFNNDDSITEKYEKLSDLHESIGKGDGRVAGKNHKYASTYGGKFMYETICATKIDSWFGEAF